MASRDISGYMVVDVQNPQLPVFLIENGGFTADFHKGSVFQSNVDAARAYVNVKDGAGVYKVIELQSVTFAVLNDEAAEDTLIESIKAKLTDAELAIIRRHINNGG